MRESIGPIGGLSVRENETEDGSVLVLKEAVR
jgi:hypothetical protein